MSTKNGEGFLEERAKWVEEELTKVEEERGTLTAHQRSLLRSHFTKEFSDVWATRDYVYGKDEGEQR